MKKIVFLCFLLFTNSLYALAKDKLNFEIQPEFGIYHGSISETVFDDVIKNTNHLESQLDWDIPAIPYFGGTVGITALKYIYAEAGFSYAIPGDSGFMQDYDWLNTYYYKNDDPTEVTNYSIHNNYLDEFYRISFSLGGLLPFGKIIKIIPLISYDYELISFTGSNGYGTYKTKNWKKEVFTGRVISYKQETNALSFGLRASLFPVKYITINGLFTYSPALTNLVAIDYHYIRSQAFMDKISDASSIHAKLSVFYNLNKMNSLGLICNFQYIPSATGTDFSNALDANGNLIKNKQWSKTSALGGTYRTLWSWSIVYSLNF